MKDIFQALWDYESPVTPDDWNVINSRLQQRKRRKITALWSTAAAVAAAVLLLFLLHYPQPEQLSPSPVVPTTLTDNTSALTNEEGQTEFTAAIAESLPTSIPQSAQVRQQEPKTFQPDLQSITEIDRQSGKISIDTAKTITAIHIAAITQTEQNTDTVKALQAVQPALDSIFRLPLLEEELLPDKKKNTKQWAVALLAGQSAGINVPNFDTNSDYSLVSDAAIEYQQKSTVLSPEEPVVTDTRHRLPVSVGLTFRYYFSRRWAVESGLVYTYLASEYSFPENAKIKTQLHYLGLPLNLSYSFIESKGLYIYASGGAMAEKGISANYSYTGFEGKSTESEAIAGLQWSLNGQLGLGYNFYKNFGLYAEPGLRWFLPDSNQPESIRTGRPVSFSFSAGLRISF
ncbi:MAG: PorT family protein [Bacteroidales bacterium]|nr:PorT family protein [Bacteroidales bacterium]MCL2133355.1 PorT family protein [Bacteroidales bacterium]